MNASKALFGTDGIRGLVNEPPIDSLSLVHLAYSISEYFQSIHPEKKLKCLIGKDTRISGYMIECALISGFVSRNIEVILLGVTPTAALSMFVSALKCDFGIMISASHNLYHDNGIKVFGAHGMKLDSTEQKKIEKIFFAGKQFPALKNIGKVVRLGDSVGRYIEFVKRTFPANLTLENWKIVLDCANGAYFRLAPGILEELGAEVITLYNQPDGKNINDKCGTTYTHNLAQAVIQHKANLGIALDGDGDRLVIIDEKGQEIRGEHLFACLCDHLRVKTAVITNVTNPALIDYLEEKNIKVYLSQVGDREVLSMMEEYNIPLGGEPSGHFIMVDFLPSSDGMISALQVLAYLEENNKVPSEIRALFPLLNQIEKTIRITHKTEITTKDISAHVSENLDLKSRYIVRKSGTEPVVRVYLWDKNFHQIEEEAEIIATCIEKFLCKAI